MTPLLSLPKLVDVKDAVLITHRGCLDGSACALTFMSVGGKLGNIHFAPAGMTEKIIRDEKILEDPRFVIFADVGVNKNDCIESLEKRGNCVVLDHHRTSLHLAGKPWCHIDAEGNGGSACGSMLLARYLSLHVGEEWKINWPLLELVDEHDRWIPGRRKDSERLAMLSVFLGQEKFIDRFCHRDPSRIFTKEEQDIIDILYDRLEENIETALKRMIVLPVILEAAWPSIQVGYIFTNDQNHSALSNAVLEKRPDVDVTAIVSPDKRTVSLRSRPGKIDVSEFAKRYDGGGHLGAAGHRLTEGIIERFVREIHD